ncbi:MAG: NAD-dependent epimerase/dehydratase family protein [bacterium]|nr:NAD-dependent epimerase/dehydratase family protein [bacterium]
MRVFVTGAAGFLGQRLLARVARDGHSTTALLLPGESEEGLGDARVVRGDITDRRSLDGLLEDHDAVVHLAALVGYGLEMDACLRVNRDGTRNIAQAAARAGARRFVHLSSVSVYGRAAGDPIDEEAPLRKTGDPYGDTKIDAERLLGQFAERGELDVTVLRPTVITGPGDDKFLGKVAANLRGGSARIIGRGTHAVDALHVDDVVELLARTLTDRRCFGRTYNVAQPSNPSWNEFLPRFAQALGVPPPRGHLPYAVAFLLAGILEWMARVRGGEPRLTRYGVRVIGRSYHYVAERVKRELDFEPKRDLVAAMQDWIEEEKRDG